MRTMAVEVQPIGSPVVCTEAGYTTAGAGSTSEFRQAALTFVLLLGNFRAHLRTYLYGLFDEHADSDATKPDRESHFGLFGVDGRAKPAAEALGRFMHLLVEPAQPSRRSTKIGSSLRLSGPALRTLGVPASTAPG